MPLPSVSTSLNPARRCLSSWGDVRLELLDHLTQLEDLELATSVQIVPQNFFASALFSHRNFRSFDITGASSSE